MLEEKKGCYILFSGIRAQVAKSYGIENVFVFVLVFEYILKVKVLVVQWTLQLPNGTRFHINDAYSSKYTRNFLSFKDLYIRRNGYHIETMNEGNVECICITSIV